MEHERILEVRNALAEALEELERRKADIRHEMSLRGAGTLPGEDAAVLEGLTKAELEKHAKEEIDAILRRNARTRPSGLTGNAEWILRKIDELAAESGDAPLTSDDIASHTGFESGYLDPAVEQLHASGLIDGTTSDQSPAPMSRIRLTPKGRTKLGELLRNDLMPASSDAPAHPGTGFLLMPFEEALEWLREVIVAVSEHPNAARAERLKTGHLE